MFGPFSGRFANFEKLHKTLCLHFKAVKSQAGSFIVDAQTYFK
jgi:hypothetical protein